MGTMLYYVDDFTDEMIPCAPTLEAWAEWIGSPTDDEGQPRVKPLAEDGERFTCTVAERFDAVASWFPDDDGGEWRIEPDIAHDWAAITFGAGLGWDADSLSDGAQSLLADVPHVDRDQDVDLALMCDHPAILVEFRRGEDGTPSLVLVEPVSAQAASND